MSNYDQDFNSKRKEMVELIERRGIRSKILLEAMYAVPRHLFVPMLQKSKAYADRPLPIGKGQTISQPYIVAFMIDALNQDIKSNILEIGTGSGYGAAVLSRIYNQVYTIERHASLAEKAKKTFKKLNYDNITVIEGNGTELLLKEGPFDGIIVTAAPFEVPENLKRQLSVGGTMIIPVGSSIYQQLLRIKRIRDDEYDQETLSLVSFVPLIGK